MLSPIGHCYSLYCREEDFSETEVVEVEKEPGYKPRLYFYSSVRLNALVVNAIRTAHSTSLTHIRCRAGTSFRCRISADMPSRTADAAALLSLVWRASRRADAADTTLLADRRIAPLHTATRSFTINYEATVPAENWIIRITILGSVTRATERWCEECAHAATLFPLALFPGIRRALALFCPGKLFVRA